MDSGMQSEANIDFIKENGFDFVMALKHKEGREFLKKHNADLEWTLFDNRKIAQWEEDGGSVISYVAILRLPKEITKPGRP
jgi:hypothetical protein